ncbi:hypothetical protein CIB48_g2818 [Xylaria polymorpha]|nr:hypothetical protein CIB48_g2818 [Xylaria polymorpha]
MSIAFTFGSLGDIITLSQIAIQLGRTLAGDVTGSSQQYKDLRDELSAFTRVIETYQQHEVTPLFTSLDAITKAIIDDCGCLMQDVLEKLVPRYGQSLGDARSKYNIKGFVKKIEWSLRETERVEKLREKLHRNSQLLGMLISITTRQSARVDNFTLLARISEVLDLVTEQIHGSGATSSLIQENTSRQDRRLESIEASLADLKEMVTEISNTSVSQQILASNSQYLRSLDPTREMPIWFEDALRCKLKLPIEWISDWKCHFRGRVGKEMVLRKLYTLEEDRSGRDLDDSQPLTSSLRRGMKINMAMVFVNADVLSGCCPRCLVEVDVPEGITFQCPKLDCGMWFKLEKITRPKVGSMIHGRRSNTEEVLGVLSSPSEFRRVRLRIDEVLEEPILDCGNNEVLTKNKGTESSKPNTVDPASDFSQSDSVVRVLDRSVSIFEPQHRIDEKCEVWEVGLLPNELSFADNRNFRWKCVSMNMIIMID